MNGDFIKDNLNNYCIILIMIDNFTGQGSKLFEENIFSQIRQERTDFIFQFIQVVQGYPFNQYLNLKRIHLYLNSKFEDATQYNNRDKIFFNIVNYPCEVATKNLNVDTKDIRLQPLNEKSIYGTFLLEKELQQWLKTTKFGNLLNQMSEELPKYGTVLLEKTINGADIVDLRRLINDQTCESIQKSRFIDVIYYMTPSELEKTGWDNVDVAIDRFSQSNAPDTYEDQRGSLNLIRSTPYIKVIKRYGEVPQSWLDGGKSQKLTRALFICAGIDNVRMSEDQKTIVEEQGVILFKSKWIKEWPFKDVHYNKVKGRWMGMGIVESLFDVQERINEMKNQKRVAMELSSIHLFQSPDKLVVKNILTDLQSGDILTMRNPLTPVENEERNLPAFQDEEESYMAHVERISFAYEAVSGATLPATTPATTTLLANQQATSVYAYKRENFTNMLRDFFNDFVGANLLKDLTTEHIMRFTGTPQDLDKLDDAASDVYANNYALKKILNGGYHHPSDFSVGKQNAIQHYKKMGGNRFVKIKQAFYNDLKFEYDFNIANEQVDPGTMIQNTQTIFTALSQNPQMLDDPRIKLLFFKYCEALGVNPGEIELADTRSTQQRSQALQANQQNPNGQGQQAGGQQQQLPQGLGNIQGQTGPAQT